MRNDVKLDGWTLTATGPESDRFLESVFFTGSGHIGSRGVTAFRTEPAAARLRTLRRGNFRPYHGGLAHNRLCCAADARVADIELAVGGTRQSAPRSRAH